MDEPRTLAKRSERARRCLLSPGRLAAEHHPTAARPDPVMRFLRDTSAASFVSFRCPAVMAARARFDVVYHLLSPRKNLPIRVKLEAAEARRSLPSSISFPRQLVRAETYDLYGVRSPAIPTCAASSRLTVEAIRCARTSRSPLRLGALRHDESASSTSRRLPQEFRNFDFCRRGKARTIPLRGMRKRKERQKGVGEKGVAKDE